MYGGHRKADHMWILVARKASMHLGAGISSRVMIILHQVTPSCGGRSETHGLFISRSPTKSYEIRVGWAQWCQQKIQEKCFSSRDRLGEKRTPLFLHQTRRKGRNKRRLQSMGLQRPTFQRTSLVSSMIQGKRRRVNQKTEKSVTLETHIKQYG